jgi:hypothetical protein
MTRDDRICNLLTFQRVASLLYQPFLFRFVASRCQRMTLVAYGVCNQCATARRDCPVSRALLAVSGWVAADRKSACRESHWRSGFPADKRSVCKSWKRGPGWDSGLPSGVCFQLKTRHLPACLLLFNKIKKRPSVRWGIGFVRSHAAFSARRFSLPTSCERTSKVQHLLPAQKQLRSFVRSFARGLPG